VNRSLIVGRIVAVALPLVVSLVACSSSGTGTGTDAGDGTGTGTTTGAEAGTGTDASTGADAGTTTAGGACTPPAGDSGVAFCGQCQTTYCCTEIEACQNDSECPTLQTCLLRCTVTDSSCVSACQNLYPNSVSLYNNLTNCGDLSCASACSTPPAGCSHPALGVTGNCQQTQFPRVWLCPDGPPEQQCVSSPDGTSNQYCCLQ
jgi:hypothetical protein